MKKFVVSIRNFFRKLSKFFSYYLRYLLEIIKYGRIQRFDKKDEKLLIAGNGPSAGRLDFDYYLSNGYSLMCVNDYALQKDRLFKYKPNYYCIIDDLMYDENQLKNNPNVKGVFDNLNSIDWDMTLLCRHCQKPPITNPHIKIVHINDSFLVESFDKSMVRRYKKNKASPGYQNVICCCVFFAITSCFKDILITGVEFDMHKELSIDIDNNVYREYRHFYGVNKVNITEAGQIKKGEIYKYFYFSYLTLYQYKLLSDYARKMGVQVTNLTVNSTIDSFDKKEPKELTNDGRSNRE